jgi:hypothetical protein
MRTREVAEQSSERRTPALSIDCTALLEENRALRLELDALRAEKFALREREIARLALSDRTFLVTEAELPHYIPYTRVQIKRMRTEGKLRYIPDPLGRKSKFLYNLRDVEATMLAGRPTDGWVAPIIDWDNVRAAFQRNPSLLGVSA